MSVFGNRRSKDIFSNCFPGGNLYRRHIAFACSAPLGRPVLRHELRCFPHIAMVCIWTMPRCLLQVRSKPVQGNGAMKIAIADANRH